MFRLLHFALVGEQQCIAFCACCTVALFTSGGATHVVTDADAVTAHMDQARESLSSGVSSVVLCTGGGAADVLLQFALVALCTTALYTCGGATDADPVQMKRQMQS